MGQTLSSFLIGIGIDNQTGKGAKEVQSSLDSIRRTALQSSLAVAGMTGGLGLMAGNTAKGIRTFSQFAEQIGASTELIAAQSEAWQRAGGSASGYMSLLERLAKMRAGVLAGNTEWISEAAKVGLNYGDMLNTAPDALLPKIIERMSRMNQQQRLNAVALLGAEPVLSNIAVDGRGAFEAQTQKQLERFQITKQMESESERLLTNWSDTLSEMEAITDRASIAIMPKLNEILGGFNDFFESNRPEIHGVIDTVFKGLADNLDLVLAGVVGIKTAGIGAMVERFTALGGAANGVGRLAKNLGQIGVAATVAAGGARLIDGQLQSFGWYNEADEWFTKKVFELTGIDMSRGGVYENQPTVIGPDRTAQLETARESKRAQTYHEQMASYTPPVQSNYPARKTEEHIHVHLSEREVAHFIRQVNSQDAEQAVRDLRSPIDR
ncbi:hypothetical protein FXE93_12390 [Vibrio cholerae]|uniref:hypothetical protein n=1 Tax=Vibrio cholerae TaxID=666 RepID=UPI0011DC312F|nr:hypothetical protein [Vibrio cholerae]TXY11225.1 hypothetical protein FXE93_12390 [Vibrio cholerae]GHY29723.1 hypothetical protein VCSRO118_0140 [Vibrio cholerae]